MKVLHYWVYILNCDNGSYYTGYTVDLMKRYREHVAGTSKCKYTRGFKPVSIAQCWQVLGDKSMAMKTEKFIKQLSKKEKTQLILHPEQLAAWSKGIILPVMPLHQKANNPSLNSKLVGANDGSANVISD